MALFLEVGTTYGNNATYWKITTIKPDYRNGCAQLNLNGYVDAQARSAGKAAIAAIKIIVPCQETATLADFYKAAKGNSEFTGAQDI